MKVRKKYCCYELIEKLGTGGMGEVWRAKHRMLTRPAAVKLIRADVLGARTDQETQRVFQRFEREAQTTALMRSQHTIDLYDFGVSDDGTFYYVMELLDGLDLELLVKRFGAVSPERVVHFLDQLCDSLAEAHESGLIHRDIKPANVYVCRYGRRVDFIKVLDFGLVKLRPEGGEKDLKITAEDVLSGTPAFMAPEQVLGDRPVDERTDIYAVGCLAYWLLTGELVFQEETAMKVLMHHVQTSPSPPSTRSILTIPKALDQIVLTCLEKDPDKRPQDADSLAEMLRDCGITQRWTDKQAKAWWYSHIPTVESSAGAQGQVSG